MGSAEERGEAEADEGEGEEAAEGSSVVIRSSMLLLVAVRLMNMLFDSMALRTSQKKSPQEVAPEASRRAATASKGSSVLQKESVRLVHESAHSCVDARYSEYTTQLELLDVPNIACGLLATLSADPRMAAS